MKIERSVSRVEFVYPSNPAPGDYEDYEEPPDTLGVRLDVDYLREKGQVTLSQHNALYVGEVTLPLAVLEEIVSYCQTLTPVPKPKKAK